MDEITYNNIILKNKKRNDSIAGPLKKIRVSNFDSKFEDQVLLSNIDLKDQFLGDKLRNAFINELKNILKFNSLKTIIDALSHFHSQLEDFKSGQEGVEELPDLQDLYCHLAPLLMRTLSDYFASSVKDNEALELSILESIRVAIEEEIYLLVTKIKESHAQTSS